MLRFFAFIMLFSVALGARAQTGGTGTWRVEPYAGVVWGEPNAGAGAYQRDLTGGIRIMTMYGYDRGVYLEGWVTRSRSDEQCCPGRRTYTRAALLAGFVSTLIDPNATGGYGLRALAGLGVLRADVAHEGDWNGNVQYDTRAHDTWNVAFSGSIAYGVELFRGVSLQVEVGYLIAHVVQDSELAGYEDDDFDGSWAPSLRGTAGVAFEV